MSETTLCFGGTYDEYKDSSLQRYYKVGQYRWENEYIYYGWKEVKCTDFKFVPDNMTLICGKTIKLSYEADIAYGSSDIECWTSDDESIVIVDDQGFVTPISAGQTTISVKTIAGLEAKCKVRVFNKANGNCGETITWEIICSENKAKLLLNGYGNMIDYKAGNSPWYLYRQSIDEIEIDERIESIGNYAFEGVENVAQILIPAGMIKIGEGAFRNCYGLEELNLPEGLRNLGKG
ncbi:MAG: leucine-rich repeat protein, partial [Lachnospiraceae bacterium]|nr:leucine-rich repeat protein [Lachnospiraceae bacterium]